MGVFVAVTAEVFLRLDVAPLQARLRRSAMHLACRCILVLMYFSHEQKGCINGPKGDPCEQPHEQTTGDGGHALQLRASGPLV